MKKKVLIIALVLVMFLLPVTSSLAYDGGLMNGQSLTIGTSQTTNGGGTSQLVTDNDETTFIEVDNTSGNEWVWYDLPKEKRITGYKIKTDVGSKFTLYLFDKNLVMKAGISSTTLKVDGTLTSLDLNGITKVALKSTDTSLKQKLYEMDVFGVDADIDKVTTNATRGNALDNVHSASPAPSDNDITTSYPIGGGVDANVMWWKFANPVDIDTYRVKMDTSTNVSLIFYAPDKTILKTIKPFPNNYERTTIPVVENVGYVAFVNTGASGVNLYEVDVYDTIPSDGSVTGLTESHTDVTATLNWLNPDLPNFTGTKIKQNGVEVATLANTANSYNINGLSPTTSYTFEVVATYSDSTTSTPKSITFMTLDVPADETPPSNVTNINVAVTDEVASFMYNLPVDTDFSHLKIYRDGVLMESNFTGTSYDDFSLVQNTTYVYKFVSVDLSGNESNGYVQSVTTAVTVDNTAPVAPMGIEVTNGGSSGAVKWAISSETDVKGYNVYIDGVKHNTSLVLANTYTIPNLVNDQTYLITVTSVDTSDNESVPSSAMSLIPTAEGMPLFEAKYDLKDVADGTSQWFNSMWLILAFSVGIPLAFLIARRVKGLLIA